MPFVELLILKYEVQKLIVPFWSYLVSSDGNKFYLFIPLSFQKWVHAHRNTHIRALWLSFLSLKMCWFSNFLYLEFEWKVMDGDWLWELFAALWQWLEPDWGWELSSSCRQLFWSAGMQGICRYACTLCRMPSFIAHESFFCLKYRNAFLIHGVRSYSY